MASDTSHPSEEDSKVRRKRKEREVRRKKVSAPDIEVLTSAGHRSLKDGRIEEALSWFKDALKNAQQLQDSRVLQACSFNLGAAYVEAGRPQRALDFLQKAAPGPKADRIPDLQFNLALAHNALGQSQVAADYFLQAAHLYRSQGAGGSEGDACMEMGHCYSRTQDWSLAVQSFLRAADSYRVAAMLDSAATALKEAGSQMVRSEQFSYDDIMSVLAESLSLTDNIKDPRTLSELYLSVGVSYCWIRCFKEAVQCFQAALDPAAQCPPLLAKVLHNLGAALNSVGQFKSAVTYHRLAARLYGSLGHRGNQARCFSNLAFAYSQLSEEEEAAESFIHALQGFRDTEDHLAQVQMCEALAECYLNQRKQQKAIQLYKEALSVLSHCKDDTDQVRDRLVERLTAALQQNLSVSLQRPCPHRPRPHRPHPQSSPVGQHTRMSDTTKSPSKPSNCQPVEQNKETGAKQEPKGQWDVDGANDGAEFRTSAPELQRSAQSHQQHLSDSLLPHTTKTPGEVWLDTEDPASNSQTLLAPPIIKADITKTLSPKSQWRPSKAEQRKNSSTHTHSNTRTKQRTLNTSSGPEGNTKDT